MLTKSSKESSHGFTSTPIQMIYMTQNTGQRNMKAVNLSVTIKSEKIVKMEKPFVVGYVFKSNCFIIDECFYKFQDLCQYRRPKQRFKFKPFHNNFLPSLKIHIEWSTNYLSFETKGYM